MIEVGNHFFLSTYFRYISVQFFMRNMEITAIDDSKLRFWKIFDKQNIYANIGECSPKRILNKFEWFSEKNTCICICKWDFSRIRKQFLFKSIENGSA